MRTLLLASTTAMIALGICAPASGQTVVMRKSLGGAVFSSGPGAYTPPPKIKGTWVVSAPFDITPSCSATAPAKRTVSCVAADGATLKDEACVEAGPKPGPDATASDYSTCGYGWIPGEWGDWSSTCSETAKHVRTPVCQRSDGTVVNADETTCPSALKPKTEETSDLYSGCVYSWKIDKAGSWGDSCGQATRTNVVTCYRQDAGKGEVSVSDGFCNPAIMPPREESRTASDACIALTNPGFEDGKTGWTFTQGSITSLAYAGSRAVLMTNNYGWVTVRAPTVIGGRYSFSMMVRGETTGSMKTVIAASPIDNIFGGAYSIQDPTPTYKRQAVTFTATTNTTYLIAGESNGVGTMLIDDAELRRLP